MTGMQPWAAPGMAAGYHLADENDFSGGSKTLTNNGSVAFGLGKFGNCAILGSSNSSKYLSRNDGLGVDLSGNCGFSAWVCLQANPGSGNELRIVDWRSTTGTGRYLPVGYKNSSGTYGININAGGTETFFAYTLTLEKWYKIDVTLASGGLCYLYINGALVGTGSRGTNSNATNRTTIGAENAVSANFFWFGNIDEVLFFNAHRSAGDIRRSYSFQKGMLI